LSDVYPIFIAIAVVAGGALAATLAAFPLSKTISGVRGLKLASGASHIKSDALLLSQIAIDARSSKTVAFEDASNEVTDPFLREALLLAASRLDAETLRNLLVFILQEKKEQFEEAERFWSFTASTFSAWGMIGALLGLMLTASGSRFADSGLVIGVTSAALGILISQCLALPIAVRMNSRSKKALHRMRMIIEGLTSIKAGDVPHITETKLKIFSGLDGD